MTGFKFNVWDRMDDRKGPTGPWAYLCTVKADSQAAACDIVAVRYGISRADLTAYDHFDNAEAASKALRAINA